MKSSVLKMLVELCEFTGSASVESVCACTVDVSHQKKTSPHWRISKHFTANPPSSSLYVIFTVWICSLLYDKSHRH
jgi:hypothetical protein